jgi:plastocyanin
MKAALLAVAALVAAAPLARAADLTVVQKDKAFQPGTLEAKVGDTLTFTNEDAVAHNVMASGADSFNLGSVKPGASSQTTLGKAGEVDVQCAIHPKMKLVIKVAE